MKILILEDDPTTMDTIKLVLERGEPGLEIDTAECGKEALDKFRGGDIDCALVDLGLPDIDGIEVIRQLRTFSQIPVIVVSARNEPQIIAKALNDGADDYITKPFNHYQLLMSLRVFTRKN